MTATIYALRFAITLATFALGLSAFSIWQYFPKLQSQKQINSVQLSKSEPICRIEKIDNVNAKETKIADTTNSPEFDASGDYYMVGKLPKGFEDFDSLSILTNEYKYKANGDYEATPIPPEGFLLTKKNFNFSHINISNKQISFVTESDKGINYKFVGEFLDDKNFYKIKGETVVLKGRLIKMQDGKKIAEINARFGYLECC